jgi:hypothetical protein
MVESAEGVVIEVGHTLKYELEQSTMNKARYGKKVLSIASTFKKRGELWVENDLMDNYLSGLKGIKKIGSGVIINGSFLVGKNPLKNYPITNEFALKFKEAENHILFANVFRSAALENIDNMSVQILRASDDLFRKGAIEVGLANFKEEEVLTRQLLTKRLMNNFAEKGLQCIRYSNGKIWSLDTYSEMLARTMMSRTHLQAGINRGLEFGYELCVVSSSFRCCDLCAPYDGVTLSMDGKSDKYPSIWDAETQGLFHPNCQHDISPYFEEIPVDMTARVDKYEQELIDEYGYKEAQKLAYQAQEKQRYIERNIRNWKRKDEFGTDDKAKNKVREWQAKQRQHLEENKFLRRNYSREQVR